MLRFAIISLHTSPFDQPGVKDGGGLNVYVRNLASHLARLGHECHVFTRAKYFETTIKAEPGFWVHFVKAGPFDQLSISQTYNYLDDFEKGLIKHIYSYQKQGIYFDAIHANYWLSGIVGHRIKHLFEIPLITTFHSLAARKLDAFGSTIETIRYEKEFEIAKCSDLILTSCKADFSETINAFSLNDLTRITIAAPGFDRAIFMPGNKSQARRALGLNESDLIALYAGRIQYLKGLDLLIKPFKSLTQSSNIKLFVAGGPSGDFGDSYLKELKNDITKYELTDSISFVGPQDQFTLSSYYRAADVVVIPSRVESFGLVALEAHACGIPVVAFNVGGIPTVVLDNASGFIIDPLDLETFRDSVNEIITNKTLAVKFSQNAHELARTFSWKKCASEVEKLTKKLSTKALVACN